MRTRYTPQRYECKKKHVSEFIVADADRLKTQKCKTCGKKAEHVRVAATINALSAATIMYEKVVNGKTHRMYLDPKSSAAVAHAEKQGFQRREIQGVANIRHFERTVSNEMKAEYAAFVRGEHERNQEFKKLYHADLRSLINRSDIDPFTADVMRAALEDQSSDYEIKNYEPDFSCAAFS